MKRLSKLAERYKLADDAIAAIAVCFATPALFTFAAVAAQLLEVWRARR